MPLHVLAFVRDYIGRWHRSPSYGEIANGLGINRKRAFKAVRSLVNKGLLLRAPGPRGLALPHERDAALRVLEALGWVVDEATTRLVRPVTSHPGVTDGGLLPPPALTYHEAGSAGDDDGDGGGE